MEQITLTKEELNKVFDKWYSEHGETPDEFEYDGDPETASDAFLEYLEEVRND